MSRAIAGISARKPIAALVTMMLMVAMFVFVSIAKGGVAFNTTFTPTTFADGVDGDPGDGVCAVGAPTRASNNRAGGIQAVCTLRAAIMESNALQTSTPSAAPILIDLSAGTYQLTLDGAQEDGDQTGDLDITKGVTIEGDGGGGSIVDGAGLEGCQTADRVFHNLAPSNETVTFNNFTIRNGHAIPGSFNPCERRVPRAAGGGGLGNSLIGGGILNQGDMLLTLMGIENNEAAISGGGIFNDGSITMNQTEVVNNLVGACNFGPFRGTARAAGNGSNHTGGGIASEGTLTVEDDSLVTENTVIGRPGGGAEPRPAGNPTIGAWGGGIYTSSVGTVVASEVSDNDAFLQDCSFARSAGVQADDALGGGIYNDAHLTVSQGSVVGDPDITDEQFRGNSAGRGGGIYNAGGGIQNLGEGGFPSGLFLFDSFVQGNEASFSGGGIHNVGQMESSNSEIAANTAFGRGPETLKNARAAGIFGNQGGGIYNDGIALLENGTLVGDDTPFDPPFGSNYGNEGGGVYNGFFALLTVDNSRVNGNGAALAGGGIWNAGTTNVLNDSTVNDNSASLFNGPARGTARAAGFDGSYPGGGIFNFGFIKGGRAARASGLASEVDITESTVSGNLSQNGAGVYNNGFLDINKSTLSFNQADNIDQGSVFGGGLYNNGEAGVTNSTFSDNQAFHQGGGILNTSQGELDLLHVTLAFNLAGSGEVQPPPQERPNGDPPGGGLADLGGDTSHYEGTLFAGNDPVNCFGFSINLDSLGGNVADDSTCELDGTEDEVVVDALIDDLDDNGGPTLTHALLEGSPAINQTGCELDDDQRSVERPQGGSCDSGAYEAEDDRGGGEPTPGPTPSVSPGTSPSPSPTPEPEECPGFEGDPRNDVVGTPDEDVLDGTPEDDIICAFEGDDILRGFDGNDLMLAGPDNDRSFGGEGDDRIRSSTGNDRSYGHEGEDEVRGGRGEDTIEGDEGDDLLRGYENDDFVRGGPGNDRVLGFPGDDRLLGDEGNDFVKGGLGDDDLNGGANNDDCSGGKGQDTIQNCEQGSPRAIADRRSGV